MYRCGHCGNRHEFAAEARTCAQVAAIPPSNPSSPPPELTASEDLFVDLFVPDRSLLGNDTPPTMTDERSLLAQATPDFDLRHRPDYI